MTWTVWGDKFETGELSNTNMYCKIKFNQNLVLKGVRTWIILYNNPTFTDLNLKLYSNEDNKPKSLLYTSTNVQKKEDIITEHNGAKEIYFDFNDVPLNGNDTYHFVMNGTGYVYSNDSHLAWMKAFPDPVYAAGYTPTFENMLNAPYQLYVIGGKF